MNAFPYLKKALDKLGVTIETYEVEVGITAHDYFMAHAPQHPQVWFVPTMPTVRPARAAEAAAWDHEYEKQRWLQWPCAWANEMMARRLP